MNLICVHFMSISQVKESREQVAVNFLDLIHTLLKDPEERRDFFLVRQLSNSTVNVTFHYRL